MPHSSVCGAISSTLATATRAPNTIRPTRPAGTVFGSVIMIHQGSSGFRGNTPDVEIQMRENLHLVNRLLEILAHHTGQSVDKVKTDSDRDYFMSPDEAKAYGLIDEVFVGNNESLISLAQKKGGEMPTAEEAAEADKVKK